MNSGSCHWTTWIQWNVTEVCFVALDSLTDLAGVKRLKRRKVVWCDLEWYGLLFLKTGSDIKKDEKGQWNGRATIITSRVWRWCWINFDVCWTCGTFTESIGSRCQDLVPLFGFYSCCSGSWQSKCCFCTTTHLIQQKSAWLTFWFPFWISKAGVFSQKQTAEVHKFYIQKKGTNIAIPSLKLTERLPIEILADSKRKE